MYEVKLDDFDKDFRRDLIITDDDGKRRYCDGGEPEDNYFGRDWKWVELELRRAYAQGRKDAASVALLVADALLVALLVASAVASSV